MSPSEAINTLQDITERQEAETERQKFTEELFEVNCSLEISLDAETDQLIGLITHAENLYNQQKKVQDNSKIRIIKCGGCRLPKLDIAAQILLTLVYLHHLPTFQMLGVIFGVVEHMIRLVNIYRVVAWRFRLKSGNYKPVIMVVCGLIKWRVGAIVICQ